MTIMEIVPLGTCACCGYPHELRVLDSGSIAIGCNKSAVKVQRTCPGYTPDQDCFQAASCPLHHPDMVEVVKGHARAAFDRIVKRYRETGESYFIMEEDNRSLHRAMQSLLEREGWTMWHDTTRNGFAKHGCAPVDKNPGQSLV
jgi:hypothetical protein